MYPDEQSGISVARPQRSQAGAAWTSALPAWLWSVDGTRILWANPVGAKLFAAANSSALAEKIFGPADARRRQVARLADRLPPDGAMRLERLRGFGAPLGGLVSCGCARLEFSDGSHGILIAAAEPTCPRMPLTERLQRLIEGIDAPIAASRPTAISSLRAMPRAPGPAFAISPRPALNLSAAPR